MGLEFVAFGDLSRGWGFVKGLEGRGMRDEGRGLEAETLAMLDESSGIPRILAFSVFPHPTSLFRKNDDRQAELGGRRFSNTLTENFSFSLLCYRK